MASLDMTGSTASLFIYSSCMGPTYIEVTTMQRMTSICISQAKLTVAYNNGLALKSHCHIELHTATKDPSKLTKSFTTTIQ